jgi:hypothetical protein
MVMSDALEMQGCILPCVTQQDEDHPKLPMGSTQVVRKALKVRTSIRLETGISNPVSIPSRVAGELKIIMLRACMDISCVSIPFCPFPFRTFLFLCVDLYPGDLVRTFRSHFMLFESTKKASIWHPC